MNGYALTATVFLYLLAGSLLWAGVEWLIMRIGRTARDATQGDIYRPN